MKRKLLSLVLTLVLIAQMIPTAAMAEETSGIDSLEAVIGESLLDASKLTAEDGAATVDPVAGLIADVADLDGIAETEPTTVDGVYQIGTAAELGWFRDAVNGGNNQISAVLTSNIDLNGNENWVPIGGGTGYATTCFNGSFDGAGYSITGVSIVAEFNFAGLFGYMDDAAAIVQNLSVEGCISGNKNYVGGIVGALANGTILNCSFSGSVTNSKVSAGYAGGIAGYFNSSSAKTPTIKGCVNTGVISGPYAGGITGYGKFGTITECYNTGAVSGTTRAGGIAGQLQNNFIASYCYSVGALSGSSTAGEIADFLYSSAKLEHCGYADKLLGSGSGAEIDCFKFVTPAELLAGLGSAYTANGGGYPILAWQVGASGETDPDLTPTLTLQGADTLWVQQGAGINETTLSLGLKNIEADDIEAITWLVETARGDASPEDIVGWQAAEDDETHLIVTAKKGGLVTVTATVEVYGDTLTATRTVSVIPQITTATIVNVNDIGAVAMGQTVEVKVSVRGGDEYDYDNYPALSYEWRYKDTSPSANIPGATARTYSIPTTAGYSEWDYLYVEIKSGGVAVKDVADVRGQLRSEDYGKLYPVAYDPNFAMPEKVKDNTPLTLPATHTVDGVTASITWTSSNTAIIATTGAVTRPATGTAKVTLTAKCAYGTAFANKTFDITAYSDEASADEGNKAYLQKAADALGSWYGPMIPAYGKDTNVATMLRAVLATKGYDDLSVAVKSVTEIYGGASLAPNGDITYFYDDPNGSRGLWFGQCGVAFTLTQGADSLDIPPIAVNLHWDRSKVQEAMRNEILSGVTDAVVLAENIDKDNIVSTLVLPRVVDGKKWAQIEWVSSDSSAVLISSENQGTADTLFAPYVGKVIRGEEDKAVTLTAKLSFNRTTLGEPEIILYKAFTVTVKALADAEATAIRAELLKKLEAGFAVAGVRDHVTGERLTEVNGTYTTTNDIQLPTTRDFGVDGKYYPVTMVSSDPDTITAPDVANAARVVAYRPVVEGTAKTVTLTVSLTDLAQGIAASKELTITVLPLVQAELDDALALMDRVKSAYYDGIGAGKYKDEFSVTGGLKPFQEAVWNDDKSGLRWVYDVRNAAKNGIVADELDNWAEQEAWRTFRSSDMTVLDHETLNYVARPAEDTFVRINSVLTHEVYGKYAGKAGYEGLEQLYKQPVAVYVMVAGKNHPLRTPEELLRMRGEAIAKLSAPISAEFTLLGNKPQARRKARSTVDTSFGDALIQITVDGLEVGTTVFGLFRKAVAQQGYTYKAVGSYVKSVTDAQGNTLSERDGGANSGWIYTVNGKMPSIYMNGYSLKEGDEVAVRFTNDYTKESGFEGSEGGNRPSGGGTGAATAPPTVGGGVVSNTKDTSTATAAQATAAIAGTGTNGGARLVNVTSISPVVALQVAMGSPSGTQILADTVVNNEIVGRLYLDPVAVGKRTDSLDTRIDTSVQGTASVSQAFASHFSNTMAFAQLGQAGAFGMNVRIALGLNIAGMAHDTLVAYVYDAQSNTYTQLPRPWVDRNGFVHLHTTKGGAIVVTDKPLALR